MIKFLLDTNILGYFVRNSSPALQKRILQALQRQEAAISVITRAEVRFGLALLAANDKRRRSVDLLLQELPALPWSVEAADCYGQIAAQLQQAGKVIGAMDAQIAAHALALGLPLVTHNTRHFKRVPGLKLDDWMA
ncbi:type II toxin-antitoxin system VapC family toxin [Dokdonella sp.]|uniref:type II toxin-antitoxin system VapC family toxin n=1 Tax=Dokdonella sp. TaxID=2291710 RepID=UPI0025BF6157|nr:type II toxin-antitoxin system VapC family toxin [Dokdonella sp.]MBX3689084.1 type II toxin-antitoxin system VapC family toxin [Dokdonella sp.]